MVPAVSLAQSNYKPGYAINLKGDTLHGFIDYREWNSSPTKINFKYALNDQSRKLTVTDIRFFSVAGLESYQRYVGPITMDNPSQVNAVKDTSFKIVTVFVKILQDGSRVTFYSYTDEVKTRFFIKEKQDLIPQELIYRVYNRPEDPSANDYKYTTVKENAYFKQLFILAGKYNVLNDTLKNDIVRSDFYQQNLLEIVSKINGVSKTEYEAKYNEHTKINVFATFSR